MKYQDDGFLKGTKGVLFLFLCFGLLCLFLTLEIFVVKYKNLFFNFKFFNYTPSWLSVCLSLNLIPHIIWEFVCSYCSPDSLMGN